MLSKSNIHVLSLMAAFSLSLCVYAQPGEERALTLSKCVAKPLNMPAAGTLAAGRDRIYTGTLDGNIVSLDSRTLEIVWRADLGGEFVSELIIFNGAVAVITNPRGSEKAVSETSKLTLLSLESGVPVWTANLPAQKQYYLGKINGAIAVVGQSGSIVVFDPADGQLKKQFAGNGRITARPQFSPLGLVLGTDTKNIIFIGPDLQESALKRTSEFMPTSVLLTKNGGFAVGDGRGNLALFGPDSDRPIWKFKSGAAVSSIAETDEGVLITSLDNFVYLVSDYNGDVIWKRRLTGRVLEGGLLIDGMFVVPIYGENSVYVLDVVKGKVMDVLNYADKDIVSRVPIAVNGRSFALAAIDTIELYSLDGCVQR